MEQGDDSVGKEGGRMIRAWFNFEEENQFGDFTI